MYDAYRNCFQYRPDVRRKLVEAVQRERHLRHQAALHAGDAATLSAAVLRKEAVAMDSTSCCCALDAAQLFATPEDMPTPPLPLSRCELHEVLLALSPRWQSYPWRLCFDTASDGFSLSSLYRRMEAVDAKQSQVKTVAFGLFFVHSGEDAALSNAQAASPADSLSASSMNVSYAVSPPAAGASHSFLEAHRSSSRRYGAAHGALQHSVLGCFTPEVPCLGRHAANIYFGSPDTFVFRLDQLSCAPSRGAWMATDVEKKQRPQGAQQQEKQQHGKAAEPHTCAPATSTTAAGAAPAYGYARLVLADDDIAGVPVPMPSRMTIEHSVGSKHTVDKSMVHSSPLLRPSEVPPLLNLSPLRATVVLSSNAAAMSGVRGAPDIVVPSPRGRRHRLLRPVHPARVVPQAPLLEKFTWCGNTHNRKFIVCNPHFFAIGGGQSGAALYVDEALQYGTSSTWCETFSAPCLFGPRMGSADVSPVSSLMQSYISGKDSPRGGPARQASGLPHVEFAISRVVWFSITEDKRNLRIMSVADASLPSAEAHRCGCGRYSCANGSHTTTLDTMSAGKSTTPSPPPASTFLHRCDLLPFAAPI
ncbi:TLD [Leishmania donovani]|uniref:Oxidation resistance protein 1 n=1 Tax=Leishmania donovani TaxID=5661 RepID=A0A6J8F3X9_LEIDO|nr:TLD [Leishmania donovani]VDZ42094.1 TLD_putative/Pfam:PF07534 [Leishmania donovani]